MTDSSAPKNPAEERVLSFMAEYEAQWRIAAPAFEHRDPDNPMSAFQLWRELMAQTTRNHFTDPPAVDLAQSFGRPASHGPEAEQLVSSEVVGDVAYVLTRSTSMQRKLNEYTLRQKGATWKIAVISQHFGDPKAPFADPAVVNQRVLQCGPDAEPTDMPELQVQLDEVHNFTEREVSRPGDKQSARAEVTHLGTLSTSTGFLSVLDFGYDNDDARPLARTVPPGRYSVDRVTAFGRNAAVRVRFSDAAPVTWIPASLPGSGHVVGVDAGCICIVDYVGYSDMTRRDKAAAYDAFSAAQTPAVQEFDLAGTDIGIAFDSGYGDGSYPAYWGLDSEGAVAQLVVDCMVLVEQDEDGVLTHL
ncbi:hypothetical protein C5B85_01425 [Pseudoclavibacter sp. AY1F1]|uniref:DUF4241 domain-containing protein n=1 Tax=Pseudoclavibacter sp. AY1F1 TaxID=2080583 RepID=UPI000CE7E1A7|nr:DUF4241 domain-containing protein [Pseudoclavibacter sp. AY1F1]PPF46967.1 hypothetical protein C5B85_01425 [Pseudoclavibacter sp. AY1F1]